MSELHVPLTTVDAVRPHPNADRLDIATLIFDDRIWHAGSRSDDGWTDYRVPSSSRGDRAVLEHRDHVHVDVID